MYWSLFRTPSRTAAAILGGRPRDPNARSVPQEVAHCLEANSILEPGEDALVAFDDTWTAKGTEGVVLTSHRLFRYEDQKVDLLMDSKAVDRITMRRVWYPGIPLFGRGEVMGKGPVTVLYVETYGTEDRHGHLRLSQPLAMLYPFVEELIRRHGDCLVPLRTLPGI